MPQKPQGQSYVVLVGVFCMLVNAALSFARLVIEVLYYAKKSDSCQQLAKTITTLDCSSDLYNHLFKDQGFNYIIAVSILDAIIIFLSTIIVLQVRKQNIDQCLQYSYLITLITSLIIVILSYSQQGNYLSSSSSEVLQASCDSSSSNAGCDFLSIQKAYRQCLIPFPVVQIILSLFLKLYMGKATKDKQEQLLMEEKNKKKIEETTIDLHIYNSRGKPFTVLELYNMGKI